MQKISPFLWFNDNALDAAKFYVKTFKKSKIVKVMRYGEGAPVEKGTVMTVAFKIQGQDFTALNGGPHYTINGGISFVVNCKDQKEIDRLWNKITKAGGVPQQCGWIKDQYGVHWQIIPANISKLIKHPKAMQAMLGMVKLDIKALKKAARDSAD